MLTVLLLLMLFVAFILCLIFREGCGIVFDVIIVLLIVLIAISLLRQSRPVAVQSTDVQIIAPR